MTSIPIKGQKASPYNFSVMTYNIHRGQGVIKKRDCMDEIIQQLGQHPADIVCFQEVFSEEDSSTHDLSSAFGEEGSWVQQNIATFVEEGVQGNAILSRHPMKRSKYYDLTVEGHEERGLLIADIEIPTGPGETTLVHVGCLHLGLIETERQTQLKKLEAVLSEAIIDKHPFVLAGDFNDWRRKVWMEPFLKSKMYEAFKHNLGHYAKSFPSFLPVLPLDRIYFSRCEVHKTMILKGKPWKSLSDHLPLWAEFSCQQSER